MPNSIKKWVNASVPEDFVALKKELNRHTFGNVNITNYTNLENGHEDAHDIRQYLQHEEVVKEIVSALKPGAQSYSQ